MNQLQKIYGHLSTINAHKLRVMKLCFQIGLWRQGLLHDLSKYSWCELKTGFKYYQGYRSPINAQKEQEGFSFSWLHHKGRNPHHWEYWLDDGPDGIQPVRMLFPYVAEMFCDRIAASQTYLKDKYTDASPLEYYLDHRAQTLIHPDTDQEIMHLLTYLKDHGQKEALAHCRQLIKFYRKHPDRKLPISYDLPGHAAIRPASSIHPISKKEHSASDTPD